MAAKARHYAHPHQRITAVVVGFSHHTAEPQHDGNGG